MKLDKVLWSRTKILPFCMAYLSFYDTHHVGIGFYLDSVMTKRILINKKVRHLILGLQVVNIKLQTGIYL